MLLASSHLASCSSGALSSACSLFSRLVITCRATKLSRYSACRITVPWGGLRRRHEGRPLRSPRTGPLAAASPSALARVRPAPAGCGPAQAPRLAALTSGLQPARWLAPAVVLGLMHTRPTPGVAIRSPAVRAALPVHVRSVSKQPADGVAAVPAVHLPVLHHVVHPLPCVAVRR